MSKGRDTTDAGNGSENVSASIEIVIRERLTQLAPPSDSCCIYRVPERLRCLNPDAYTPQFVSIGPFHHGLQKLEKMEEHKYRYLKEYLDRTQVALESCIKIISSQETELRSYYDETIKYSSDDFVMMILVDSAFILEFFLKCDRVDFTTGDKRIIMAGDDIISDLLLLENQVPFFILEALFDHDRIYPSNYGGEKLSLIQLYLKVSSVALDEFGEDSSDSETEVEGEHFLDMGRKICLPPETNTVGESSNDATAAISSPSITELYQAGVKFKRGPHRNLFSIKFENGILEIPRINIGDYWEPMLRNLAAFEQCHYQDKRIADYLSLLDSFVNTPNDVELLIEHGIVTNSLGDSNEACSMINGLGKQISVDFSDFYFATLCEELHKHCKKPWNKWKANLRQSYLNTPWAILSIVAAVFLIILTIIQTVCSLCLSDHQSL